MREIVLPSGRFAAMRPITWGDFVAARTVLAKYPALDADTLLLAATVTVDGEALRYQDVLQMDVRDVVAMQRLLNSAIIGPVVEG